MTLKSTTNWIGCLAIVASMLAGGDAAGKESAAEISVKAAVVHKIAKFVSWPDGRFEARDMPLRICVLGDRMILDAFESLSSRPIHGRTLNVMEAPDPLSVASSCEVLYLAHDDERSAEAWLESVAGQPVLTFGETGGYAGDGSIVSMAIRRNKIRFSINLKANADTGLRISAQLLQLAASVGSPGS